MSEQPQLSVVIPTRNRRTLLHETLGSLHSQTIDPQTYEIVVVADGCTDGTAAAVRALAQTPAWAGHTLRCVEQVWAGAAAARNTGLGAAAGTLVLFLDDDCRAAPGLLAAHLAAHHAPPGGARVMLGQIVPGPARGALARELAEWWRRHYRRRRDEPADFTALFSGNVSLPRVEALATGGFDAQLPYGEDIEFGFRLQQRGLPFVYAPEAIGEQRNPKAARALLRDFYRSGRSCVQVYRKWPATLPRLPLSAFGETTLRLRVGRGLLLAAAENRLAARLVDWAFLAWAGRPGQAGYDRPLFDLARSYYFWRGVRAAIPDYHTWRRFASPGVPVLMYHSIAPLPGGEPDRYTVPPDRFARQMRLLRLLGYRVRPLDRLVAAWAAGRLPPARSLALTFDDAYRDARTEAWPVLRRLRYPATLFVVTGHVGGCNSWDAAVGAAPKALLNQAEVIALDRQGFRAESHSVTHADLTQVAPTVAEAEIGESRRTLEAWLARPVTMFAYPYGEINPAVEGQVAAAGYAAAFAVDPGFNTPRTSPWHRPRIEIRGDDSLLAFAVNIWAGDDRAFLRLQRRLPRWLRR